MSAGLGVKLTPEELMDCAQAATAAAGRS